MLQILYEIVFAPQTGLKRAIKRDSLLEPLILILVIGLINGLAISARRDQIRTISILYIVALLIFWFTQSAFLNMIGELLGGRKGGRGLLICVGYTIFPFLFLTPFHSIPEPIFASFSLILLAWSTCLGVLAVKTALDLTLKRAIFTCMLPFLIYIIISTAGTFFSSSGSIS